MVIFSHPTGNANVRAALNGLSQADLLLRYYTTVATFPGNVYDRLSRIGPLGEFSRRTFAPHLRARTSSHPWRELGRMAASRAGIGRLVRHETGPLSIDAVYGSLDRRVAKAVSTHATGGIYAYEDGAYHSFNAAGTNGTKKLYDLPTGYWRVARQLLGEVAERQPEWAATLQSIQNSPAKLARKDEELRLADHVFVASRFTAATLRAYPGRLPPVSIIPYGFPAATDDRGYASPANRPLRLLFVGSLSQQKGIAELFAAVARFPGRVALTVVGRKPSLDCPALNEQLERHRYIPSLPHPEVLALMRTQDVLLFPTHFDGFGLVITEAMSQGTPVIATERSAGPDLITPGQDGFIVPAGSDDALAEKIEYFLRHPEAVGRMGRAAARTARLRPWHKYGTELAAAVATALT